MDSPWSVCVHVCVVCVCVCICECIIYMWGRVGGRGVTEKYIKTSRTSLSDHLTKILIGSSINVITITETSHKWPHKPDIKGGDLQKVPLFSVISRHDKFKESLEFEVYITLSNFWLLLLLVVGYTQRSYMYAWSVRGGLSTGGIIHGILWHLK